MIDTPIGTYYDRNYSVEEGRVPHYCWVFDPLTAITYPGFTTHEDARSFAEQGDGPRMSVYCKYDD